MSQSEIIKQCLTKGAVSSYKAATIYTDPPYIYAIYKNGDKELTEVTENEFKTINYERSEDLQN